MIILIDNYDSFSYNLYQLVGTIDPDIKVIRNDELTVDEIRALKPSRIILSPGPGFPKDAGICIEAAKTLGKEIPTLGVCLGHQAICEAYGATVSYAKELMKYHESSQISFAGGCERDYSRNIKGDCRDQRRRSYGSYASGVSHLRCTVPSRIHPDTRWKNHIE